MARPLLSYLPYVFFVLVGLNIAMLGYYNFFKSDDSISTAVKTAQSQLKNPITFTNLTSELPAQIGTKK